MADEQKILSKLFDINSELIPKEWNNEKKGLRKELINFIFISIRKPSEFSKCLITVSDIICCDYETDYLKNVGDLNIVMGSALTPVDIYLELFLMEMLTSEKSRCFIKTKTGNEISFTLKLNEIIFGGYFYEISANEMFKKAQTYKENGVKMFKKYPIFAQDYFNKSAKCLLAFLPFKDLNPEIENVDPNEFENFLEIIYMNISACLLKECRFEDILSLLKFTDREFNVPEKALYRKALAYFNLKKYEESKTTLERINYLENKEFLILWNKNVIQIKIENDKYANICRKMFG